MKTLLLSILSCLVVTLTAEAGDTAGNFRQDLQPFLTQNCHDCRAEGAEEGCLDLTELSKIAHDAKNNTPFANMFVVLAPRRGVETGQFGGSTAESIWGLEPA